MKIKKNKEKLKNLWQTKHKKRKLLLVGLTLILALFTSIVLMLKKIHTAHAWFDDSYAYRRLISFNHNASISSERRVTITIDTASLISQGKMQSDCDDTRFTTANGAPMRYQLTGTCNSTSTTYDVVFPNIENGTNNAYVYYGNPSASSGSSNVSSVTSLTPSGSITTGSEEKGRTPILYWAFSEGYGTTAFDSTSQAKNGTISDSTIWRNEAECVAGKCIFLSNNQVFRNYSSNDANLNPGSESFSASVWIKKPLSISATEVIISRADGVNGVGWKMYLNSSGQACFGIDSTAGSFPEDVACSSASVADSVWHHITAVKNGTSSIVLYIDGKRVASDTSITASSISGTSSPFRVGIDADGTNSPFNGFIDEVKYYNFALSESQILTNYTNQGSKNFTSASIGAPTTTSLTNGLIGWWRMDESLGDASDSSGNSYTLTNNGTTPFVGGRFGNAPQFNGTSRYFSTTASIPSVQTISFWLYPTATTDEILQLTSSASITISSGAITTSGMTNSQVYVNGRLTSQVSASRWQNIVVTTQSPITANAFEVGRVGGNYINNNSQIDDLRLYNRILSPMEAEMLYNFGPPPVAYWKMDENTDTTTNDSSGNGNHSSTFSGNTTWGQGEYGSGLVFDGDDDVVQITESASTDLGAVIDSYTISAWIKTNQTVTTTASIIAKNDGAGAYPYSLHINSSQQACFQISDGTNSPQTCSTVTVNNNQWRYITGVRDVLQDRIYIYIDGILQNSTTDTTTATAVNNDNLSIGNSGTSYTANDFAGSIDDIKIYNYARTQKQIIEDMNAGHPLVGTPVTGAVAYYKFDEAALNTCPGGTNDFCDSSSNGNDFAFSGAIGGYTTEGRISSAFSGTGSVWASRSDDNDFDFEANEDFSISAWVRSNSATNPSANQFIFTKQQATNNPGYRLFFNTIGQIVCDLDDDTTSYPEDSATTTTDFYDAQWHHVVCIRDIASGRLYLYVDGRLEAEDTSLSATGSIANSTTIYIADDNGTAANSFTGRIDELKIYRAALTYSDILIDINQGKSVVMGSTSTESDGQTASNAKLREYCVPGDTSTCTPPVIHVKFDENRGTNVFDTSGNGQTGNLNHANLFWDIGKTGSAVNLSRSGNAQTRYVTFPDNDILDFGTSTNFTISVWVKRVSNLPETDLADFYQIVSKGLDNDNNPGYRLVQYGTQELAMYISQDQATNYYEEFTSTDPFTNNLWYHILATVDRSSEQNYKIFINGIEQQTNFLGSLSSVGNIDNALDLRIGYMRDNDVLTPVSSPFVVDDVKIYNYIRNNAQIAWDFNRGAPIARYKMDECQGTLVYDASVNANAEAGGKNGTWSGSSGTNTSAGTCGTVNTATVRYNGRNGKFGSSLDFDGTDDTVTVTNTSAIDLNEGLVNGLTISAWVYPRSDGEGDAGRIFDKGSNNYCRLANETSGQAEVRCRLNLATNAEFTAPETIPLNQWSHIAFSWTNDSDDEITIWINGTPYTSNALYSGDPSTDTSNFFIGNNSSGANTFDGQIDDVRIYPYELTQILIRNLINESSSVRFGPVIGTP